MGSGSLFSGGRFKALKFPSYDILVLYRDREKDKLNLKELRKIDS